jgi:hypothetical protein
MKPLYLDDFSGGLAEVRSPSGATTGTLARAHGLIVESPVEMRTQWQLQEFAAHSFTAIQGFASHRADYLVGIKADGTVWWTTHPTADADVPTVSWTQFSALTPTPNIRFLGEIPFEASQQTITNVNPVSGDPTSLDVTLYGKSALLLNNISTSTSPVVIYESVVGTLAAFTYTDKYPALVPHPTIENFNIPKTGVMPNANVGVTWGDRVVLADISWFASTGTDQTLGPSTVKRYINAMWFSEPGAVDTYDPLNVVVPVSSDSRIVSLKVVDVGLLIVTTSSSGADGLVLLRGTPSNFRVETLRAGLVAPRRVALNHKPVAAHWAETGTVVFVDEMGGVWQTNGTEVLRIDGLTLAPLVSAPTDDDHVVPVGQWLFWASGNRLMVMRALRSMGAWTEVAHPGQMSLPNNPSQDAVVLATTSHRVVCMTEVGDCLWFLSNGVPFRFVVGSLSKPRGTFAHTKQHGGSPSATWHTHNVSGMRLSTPTVAVPQGGDPAHQRALWHRTGVRLSSRSSGRLVALSTQVGPALDTAVGHTVTVDEAVTGRYERVVPAGVGYAVEASATVTLAGDVNVESVSLWVSGGEPAR